MNKTTMLLCAVSAVLGALVAIGLYDPPETEPKTAAQEADEGAPVRITIGSPAAPRTESQGLEDLTPEERVSVTVY
ncbi:unnamed protein product, partial [marine sediment metagenome]